MNKFLAYERRNFFQVWQIDVSSHCTVIYLFFPSVVFKICFKAGVYVLYQSIVSVDPTPQCAANNFNGSENDCFEKNVYDF